MAEKKPLPSLKAMAEDKQDGIQKATYFKVDPTVIQFEAGFNLREEGPDLDEHIERLYQSMKAGAYVPPIDVTVEAGVIIVRDGHCRTRAARRLRDEGIEYMLEARQFRGNEVECVLHMVSSAQGKSLTPLEQGRGFLRLTKYGMTVVQIVERTGLHRTTIDNYLLLAEAPVEVQVLINGGVVSSQVAVDAIRKHGKKAATVLKKLVAKVKKEGGTKVTKKHATGFKVPQPVALSFVKTAKELKTLVDPEDTMQYLDDDDTVEVPVGKLKELFGIVPGAEDHGL